VQARQHLLGNRSVAVIALDGSTERIAQAWDYGMRPVKIAAVRT
jgi:hypothetical protein